MGYESPKIRNLSFNGGVNFGFALKCSDSKGTLNFLFIIVEALDV